MNESNSVDLHSIETIANTLSDQKKFRLAEINEVKDYFSSEIQVMSKKLSTFSTAFNYIE